MLPLHVSAHNCHYASIGTGGLAEYKSCHGQGPGQGRGATPIGSPAWYGVRRQGHLRYVRLSSLLRSYAPSCTSFLHAHDLLGLYTPAAWEDAMAGVQACMSLGVLLQAMIVLYLNQTWVSRCHPPIV